MRGLWSPDGTRATLVLGVSSGLVLCVTAQMVAVPTAQQAAPELPKADLPKKSPPAALPAAGGGEDLALAGFLKGLFGPSFMVQLVGTGKPPAP